MLHGNEQLFASKYKLYLPTEEKLRAEIETQKAMFFLQQKEKKIPRYKKDRKKDIIKMTKILFICHGNICRSPMAEFVFKDMVRRAGRDAEFYIESAATSREEIGNDVHRGTKAKLREQGIAFEKRQARQVTRKDYEDFDYLILMDRENKRGLSRIISADPAGKVHMLLEFAGKDRDIADPWYTGNFDETYDDVVEGCRAFLAYLDKVN